jgi:hypothetical protein
MFESSDIGLAMEWHVRSRIDTTSKDATMRDDLLFCDKCGNLYYWKNGSMLYCRCGNTKSITKEEKRPIEPPIEAEYNFKNKEASRRVVYQYLLELRDRRLIASFDKARMLVLTSPEALDFKQIFHPLGFKNENISIFECDPKVFKEIEKNPVFDGCKKFNMDLVDYDGKDAFDLLYLDFKSNLCWDVLDIIKHAIANNSHDGTVFYINLLMAREIPELGDLFESTKKTIMEEYGKTLLESIDKKKRIDHFNLVVAEMAKRMPGMKEPVIRELLSRTKEFKDIPKEDLRVDEIVKRKASAMMEVMTEAMDGHPKRHAIRRNFVRLYVKMICELLVNYPLKMKDVWDGKVLSVDADIIPDELDERESRLAPILRYFAHTLDPYYFTQIMYKNKHGQPFLSSMFVLKEQRKILSNYGYADFSGTIMRAFGVLAFKRLDYLKQRNFDRCLFASKVFSLKRAGFYNERSVENQTRDDINAIRNIYLDMEKLGIASMSDWRFSFRFVDTNLNRIVYNYNAMPFYNQIRALGSKVKRIDESATFLATSLALDLLARLDKDLYLSSIAEKTVVVDLDEGDGVNEFVDENFDGMFEEDRSELTMKVFDDELTTYIDESKNLKMAAKDVSIQKKLKGAKIKIDMGDMNRVAEQIHVAASSLLYQEEKEEVKKTTEEQRKGVPARKSTKELAYEFIESNPGKKAKEIAAMVNEHVQRTCGINPGITDCQVRAYKYWNRVKEAEVDS